MLNARCTVAVNGGTRAAHALPGKAASAVLRCAVPLTWESDAFHQLTVMIPEDDAERRSSCLLAVVGARAPYAQLHRGKTNEGKNGTRVMTTPTKPTRLACWR